MDYPYDHLLDPRAVQVLAAFRACEPSRRTNQVVLGFIEPGMPADLKAYLHTCAHHPIDVTVGDAWLGASHCRPLGAITGGYAPGVIATVERQGCDGLDLDAAVVMGNTADGELIYALAWRPGAVGLTVVRFCLSGYTSDGFRALGALADALVELAIGVEDLDDVPPALRAMFDGPG